MYNISQGWQSWGSTMNLCIHVLVWLKFSWVFNRDKNFKIGQNFMEFCRYNHSKSLILSFWLVIFRNFISIFHLNKYKYSSSLQIFTSGVQLQYNWKVIMHMLYPCHFRPYTVSVAFICMTKIQNFWEKNTY